MTRRSRPFLSGAKRSIYRTTWALAVVLAPGGSVASDLGRSEPAPRIQWRSGAVELTGKDSSQIRDALAALAAGPEERHVVVQLDRPLDPKLRAELRSNGLRLLNYVGGNAFFASVSANTMDAVTISRTESLIDVTPIKRSWRLHPYFLHGNVPAWAVVSSAQSTTPVVGAYVVFHPDVALVPAGVDVVLRHGASVRSHLESINGLVIELPFDEIPLLADEDAVQWIEPPLPRMEPVNDSNRAITGADIAQAPPYDLNGSGVTVLVYDGGTARATHVDFGGRLTVRDGSGMHYHPTHVAGTIGGDGTASGGAYRGMAPGVIMESYGYEYDGSGIFLYSNPGDIEDDYTEAISSYGADISNNSIGTNTCSNGFPCGITGDYGVTSMVIDSIVAGTWDLQVPFRVVWANGNERDCPFCPGEHQNGYHSTAPPSCAKNHLTVGALNSNDDSQTAFTSWGPCDDGRLKPDIAAPGCQSNDDYGVTSTDSAGDTAYVSLCGTSMASPTVCGLGALLLQDFRATYTGEPDFRNSTLRAVLAHTAVDLGNAGPDYSNGYGSVRIQPAIDLVRAGNFLEAEVIQGEVYSVLVLVGPGEELKVTLVWDDAPGTPNVNPALVNDLDLVVYAPSSVQHFPWTLDPDNPSAPASQTQADHINNIEQVFVGSPTTGAWRVEVHGSNVPVGPQVFSLSGTPALIRCSTAGVISLNRTEYACDGEAEIRVIDCDLNTDDGIVETVQVTIAADTEPTGEVVLLTETAPATAAFRGTIALGTTDAPGVLHITEGDTVTATYVDEDDGFGGVNVEVQDTAVVDCQSPVISNVQTVEIGAFDATATFNTDEPTLGTVRYGLACAALGDQASGSGYQTTHSIHLTGLGDKTPYFYAVDAEDEAGNTSSDDNGGGCFSFTTPDVPDYFTEQFSGDNDLDNRSVTFTPDGSDDFYHACREVAGAFPTDPTGGTALDLADDAFMQVNLADGRMVSVYGQAYSSFFVGSNGYVTFDAGSAGNDESFESHFSMRRISALFDDLDPGGSGGVCPGEGDCCLANLTPGCEDEACCNAVCAVDSFCCSNEWDSICADEAFSLCDDLCLSLSRQSYARHTPRGDPAARQAVATISWKQLEDGVAVTYENVPQWNGYDSNSFQIEMFFDGTLRITWLSIDATDGIAGLSEGNGLPPEFRESDLSAYGSCDCLIVTPSTTFSSTGFEGGPFTPGCTAYTLTNPCASPLDWTVLWAESWLDVDPTDGPLGSLGVTTVDTCLNAGANTLAPGIYRDILDFTNVTSGAHILRSVELTVWADCPPPVPANPDPPHGEVDVPLDADLAWSSALAWLATQSDPCPASHYDVYFGMSDPPATLICEDLTGPPCDPGTPDYNTTYSWQVVARSPAGETPGPVWSFTTVCAPSSPPQPERLIGVPGQPDCLDPPSPLPGEPVSVKNRFLSIKAGDPGRLQAVRVTFISLPPPFDAWNSSILYAGPPSQVCENAGQGLDSQPPDCGPAPRLAQAWFWAAPLVCDALSAHAMDWTTLGNHCVDGLNDGQPCTDNGDCPEGSCGSDGIVHLFHEGLIPRAIYSVQVTDAACSLQGDDGYSDPLIMTQGRWGDLVSDCTTCPCGPPDDAVNVVTDVVSLVNKFENLCCAPQKARGDLRPHNVDFKIDVSDVVQCLNAFMGDGYPFGSGQCIDEICSGGSDHGQVCTSDGDCSSDPCTLGRSRRDR